MPQSWSQMSMQVLSLENVLARVRLDVPHGWEWELLEFNDRRWHVVDSGCSRSSRDAAQRLCQAILDLVDSQTI